MRPPSQSSDPISLAKPVGGLRSGMAYVGPAAEIPALLATFGADAEEVIAAADLDPRLFDSPDDQISMRALERLLLLCAERTNCPHFGLLVGQRTTLASLGILGRLMKSSATLGHALRSLESHLPVRARGGLVQLEVDDGIAVLSYCPYETSGEGAGQICDGALAAIMQVLRALCGPAWAPAEVLMPRRVPASLDPYRPLFRAPVRFNQELAALVFPAEWLDHPLSGANPIIHRRFEQHTAALERSCPLSAADELRRQLRRDLMKAKCSSVTMAQRFSVHRRTLNRHLKADGTGFKMIRDELRSGIARQLLADTDLPLVQIAAALDFSEPAAFTHAFRRWSGGVAPSVWRAQKYPLIG
jgi:AraC-like DNA-binding protein